MDGPAVRARCQRGLEDMKAPKAVPLTNLPPASAVSRLKERLRQSWSQPGQEPHNAERGQLPALVAQRPVGFPASIAEFLLVFRLRARRRSALSADILERAVRVVFVTCQHWFGAGDLLRQRSRRHD